MDFSKFKEDVVDGIHILEDTVVLLDTPGLWSATISVFGSNRERNITGLITFNVQRSTYDSEDETELDVSEVLNEIYEEMAVSVKKIVFFSFSDLIGAKQGIY